MMASSDRPEGGTHSQSLRALARSVEDRDNQPGVREAGACCVMSVMAGACGMGAGGRRALVLARLRRAYRLR
jgi:hypothetical protein